MIAPILLFCMLVFHCEIAHANSYTVGGASGWTFGVASWPNGKQFKASDTLNFIYNNTFHNVVEVNKAGYHSCSVSNAIRKYNSGHDEIALRTGNNYFICGFPGHCQRGMRIALKAT
ncbi:hypothetical protein RIF29_18055 [Crotalaria pallida]|uniref:Basic blue protein n=1 Tax=Crotalaria pallida TaxID=3830 RepID=A0AAN9IF52_CROPI